MKLWEKCMESDLKRVRDAWMRFAETGFCKGIRCEDCPFDEVAKHRDDDVFCYSKEESKRKLNEETK